MEVHILQYPETYYHVSQSSNHLTLLTLSLALLPTAASWLVAETAS